MTTELQSPPPAPQPARRSRLGLALFALACLAVGAGAGSAVTHHLHEGAASAGPAAKEPEKKKPLFICPMHPTITQDHPGDCPLCGMKLVPAEAAGGADTSAAAHPGHGGERKVKLYRSPMDPKQTSPVPRKDEMGMDYLPVYEDEGTQAAPVAGLAAVSIDPARQQIIGLRTATATKGKVGGSWKTVGRIAVDQTRVRKVNLKVEGYVEKVFVDFVGRPVRKGEPLFTLYSPTLLAAQNEYLLALQTRAALAQGGGSLSGNGDALIASARRKLELWDVPAAELERLGKTGQPSKTLTFYSPISGVVTAKNVVEGARVAVGDSPYEITDLGMVWAMADAYETDLANLRVGMAASLRMQAYPNRTFEGRVDFVEPLLDPKTRTVKVHLHFPNRTGELKPEMFGEVELKSAAREGLLVPADSVVHSGTSDVVFLALGDGKFEPRAVKLGAKSGEQVEVESGLDAGQQVVTGANFLVDSESQLRASLAALGGK